MRRLLLVQLFLAFTLLAKADENVRVEFGPKEKFNRKVQNLGIVGENGKYFYVLESRQKMFANTDFFLAIYDKLNFSLKNRKEIKIPKINDKELAVESVEMLGSQLVLISSYFDKKTLISSLYMQMIDEEGVVSTNLLELDKIQGEKTSSWIKFTLRGSFNIVSSRDRSKFLVLRNEPNRNYTDKEKFHYKVYDKNLNVLWSAEMNLPYTDFEFVLTDYNVDNTGNIAIMAKRWKVIEKTNDKGEKKVKIEKSKKNKPNYFYSIVTYNWKKDKMKTFDIALGTRSITDITMSLNESETDLVCAGFFDKVGGGGIFHSGDLIGGSFYLRIDKENASLITSSDKDFDEKFLELFMSKKKAKKGGQVSSFDLRNFVVREDGSAVLCAEQFYIREVTTCDQRGNCRTTYYYYFNDIIVVSFNKDGSTAYYARVPKKQVSANDGGYYSSYLLKVFNDKLIFIFNDHKKNMANYNAGKTLKFMNKPKSSVAVMVTLDAAGTMTRKELFKSKEQRLVLKPKASNYTRNVYRDNKVFIYGNKFAPFGGSYYKYGQIVFS